MLTNELRFFSVNGFLEVLPGLFNFEMRPKLEVFLMRSYVDNLPLLSFYIWSFISSFSIYTSLLIFDTFSITSDFSLLIASILSILFYSLLISFSF